MRTLLVVLAAAGTIISGCGKSSRSQLTSEMASLGAAQSSDDLRQQLIVSLDALAKQRYTEKVDYPSEMDPPPHTFKQINIGRDGVGFDALVEVRFKMNAKPDRLIDKITYGTPLILMRSVTFQMEVESIAVDSDSIAMQPQCALSKDEVIAMIADAIEQVNATVRARH
ncbi:MAG: hypothetical protein NTY08_09320 [Proteobacteria bacterium]|nr:hypothetical protein [Pseudomonadota bacterium]